MEKKTINIENFINQNLTMADNYQTIAMKIVTLIVKERNITGHNNVILGHELLLIIEDIPNFHVNTYDINSNVGRIGVLMGVQVFQDYTGFVKGNEYLFFENEKSLQFMKREQKLKRILDVY